MFDRDKVVVISTEVSPKLCIVDSGKHAQQGVDEGVFLGRSNVSKPNKEEKMETLLLILEIFCKYGWVVLILAFSMLLFKGKEKKLTFLLKWK